MATKPQRRRRTREQRKQDGKAMAQAVTKLVEARIAKERKRNRWIYVALAVLGLLGVVF